MGRKCQTRFDRSHLRLVGLEARVLPASHLELISLADPLAPGITVGGDNAQSNRKVISDDGRYVVFESTAPNIVAGQLDSNSDLDVFLFDRELNQTKLVSHIDGNSLTTSAGRSRSALISGDGRYITFLSFSKELVANFVDGNNALGDVFIYDRLTDKTTLASHSSMAILQGANKQSDPLDISADGSIIIFSSQATDSVSGQSSNPNNYDHVYVYNRSLNEVRIVTHAPGNPTQLANNNTINAQLSNDGKFVAFSSSATNLIPGYTGSLTQVYLFDRISDTNTLVSHSATSLSAGGNQGATLPNSGFRNSTISADGRHVGYESLSTNLISGYSTSDGMQSRQVYSFDRLTNANQLISRSFGSSTIGAQISSFLGSMSQDGNRIVFRSAGADHISGFSYGTLEPSSNTYVWHRETNTTALVSHQSDIPLSGANGSSSGIISADGSRIVLASGATNLIEGFVDGNESNSDLFIYHVNSGVVSVVSHAAINVIQGGNDRHLTTVISASGQFVVFTSAASDLLPGNLDNNRRDDVFVRDVVTDQIQGVSQRQGAISPTPNGPSNAATNRDNSAQMSADGRYFVYASDATNIVPGQIDANGGSDIFLFDRQSKQTILVSRVSGTTATAGNFNSYHPHFSSDGRYVTYSSNATNLVSGFVDGNGPFMGGAGSGMDLYLFDRVTGQTTLVSHQFDNPNAGGNADSGNGSGTGLLWFVGISGDGQYIAYRSQATNLIEGFVDGNGPGPGSNGGDIFLFDRLTGNNNLVSHKAGFLTTGGNSRSWGAELSRNGQFVVFQSAASDLMTGLVGSGGTIYIYDRISGTTQLVDHAASGPNVSPNGGGAFPVVTPDGRFVAFSSSASNLVAGLSVPDIQAYVYDRLTGQIECVSHPTGATLTGGDYRVEPQVQISDDGQVVIYYSGAGNLVPGFVDNNGTGTFGGFDLYSYDRTSGNTSLITHSTQGLNIGSNGDTRAAAINGNGRFITFLSPADDLLPGYVDQNTTGSFAFGDVYVHDHKTGQLSLLSHDFSSLTHSGNDHSVPPLINDSGSIITFMSYADNILAGDANGYPDYFAYVTPPPRVTSLQINDGSPQRSTIRSMTVTIDDYVFLDAGYMSLVDGKGLGVGVQGLVEYQDNKTIVTVTFSGGTTQFGSLADGDYTLTLNTGQVSGVGFLDGNGDGIGGDNFTFAFHRLFGDGNGDRKVNAVDFAALRGVFGSGGIGGATFDFNNDGLVNAIDFAQFRARFGMMV